MSQCTLKWKHWTNEQLEMEKKSIKVATFCRYWKVGKLPQICVALAGCFASTFLSTLSQTSSMTQTLVIPWFMAYCVVLLDDYLAVEWIPDQLCVYQRVLHSSAKCCGNPFGHFVQVASSGSSKRAPDHHTSFSKLLYRRRRWDTWRDCLHQLSRLHLLLLLQNSCELLTHYLIPEGLFL